MPSPPFLTLPPFACKINHLAETFGSLPLRGSRRYKGCFYNRIDEHISWIARQTYKEAEIMDWTALFIGISTGLLGLLSVYLIWEKSRFVLDQIGENGRGALLFNTFLSQFGKTPLTFVWDDIGRNDHAELCSDYTRSYDLWSGARTNCALEIDMG